MNQLTFVLMVGLILAVSGCCCCCPCSGCPGTGSGGDWQDAFEGFGDYSTQAPKAN